MESYYIPILIGVVALVIVYVILKNNANKKKAQTGEDKAAINKLLAAVVPAEEYCTYLYATWEWTTYRGKKQITEYWYYGIAFNSERIFILPLSFEGKTAKGKTPVMIEKSDLGMVNSQEGANWVELYDKNQKEIISLMSAPENLNDDRFHPVNILQAEEHNKFIAWKDSWMSSVNASHGVTVTGKIKRPLKKQK